VTTGLLSLLLGGLGYGLVSAFVPLFNSEAFVVAAAASGVSAVWWGVVGLTLGQTAGKVVIFVLARKGVHRRFIRERPPRPAGKSLPPWRQRIQSWSARLLVQLDRRWVGGLVVFVSSTTGLPPLAVVSVMAGLRRTPATAFTVAVFAGRLVRFGVLAWPVAALAS
jgi:membrane protein YqaA with SNARE-associated domain